MERVVFVTTLPPLPSDRVTLRVVDGTGLYVYHYTERIPSDDEIRQHLFGVRLRYVYVEADNIAEALQKFPDEHPGAVIGERAFALELRPSEYQPVIIYPECPRMHVNKLGSFVCGELEADGLKGVNGGCIVYGYEPPEDCPIEKFLEEESGLN